MLNSSKVTYVDEKPSRWFNRKIHGEKKIMLSMNSDVDGYAVPSDLGTHHYTLACCRLGHLHSTHPAATRTASDLATQNSIIEMLAQYQNQITSA